MNVYADLPFVAADDPSEIEFASLPMSALASGERRMEAETYLTGGYGIRVQIESSVPFERLDKLANVWQPGRLKGTQVGEDDGLPFFTATQVFDIRPTARKWVAPSKTPDLSRRLVERGWILVTCSGGVGDSILSYRPHLDTVISHDLLRVQVRDARRHGYVYSFLRSRFGRAMLRSSQYGSVVKHLEPEHLQNLPVPIAESTVYTVLDQSIGHVFELRERAFELTKDAESLYAEQFSSPVAQDDDGYLISASSMFSGRRRLDAYHYTQTVAVYGAAKTESLALLTDAIIGVPRFKHVYSDSGIPYLDSEDLFKINPEITKFIPKVTKKDASRYYVTRGWLLMASSGQVYGVNGSVMLASAEHEDKIISNHVIRIVPKGIRSGYLALALGHPTLGRQLVLRLTFGSSVPEIAPEDLASMPIPRLGDVEDQIADRMEDASALRMRANQEEDAAVEYLEREIEHKVS